MPVCQGIYPWDHCIFQRLRCCVFLGERRIEREESIWLPSGVRSPLLLCAILSITIISAPSLTQLILMNCLVPQVLLCQRFPSGFYTSPTSVLFPLPLLLHPPFTHQKFFEISTAESSSATTGYFLPFKCIYYLLGESGIFNQIVIYSLDRHRARSHV